MWTDGKALRKSRRTTYRGGPGAVCSRRRRATASSHVLAGVKPYCWGWCGKWDCRYWARIVVISLYMAGSMVMGLVFARLEGMPGFGRRKVRETFQSAGRRRSV